MLLRISPTKNGYASRNRSQPNGSSHRLGRSTSAAATAPWCCDEQQTAGRDHILSNVRKWKSFRTVRYHFHPPVRTNVRPSITRIMRCLPIIYSTRDFCPTIRADFKAEELVNRQRQVSPQTDIYSMLIRV